MEHILNMVDHLFSSSGWIVHSNGNRNRSYYRKHFELDVFEIKERNQDLYRVTVPLHETSYSVSLPAHLIYDYIYTHLQYCLSRV